MLNTPSSSIGSLAYYYMNHKNKVACDVSLCCYARLLHHFRPFDDLGPDVRSELLGSRRCGIEALLRQALLRIRHVQHLDQVGVELREKGFRHRGGSAHSLPGRDLVTWHAGFRNRQYVGQL